MTEIILYEQFMGYHSFPIPTKEFNKVDKVISLGLIHLVKSLYIESKEHSYCSVCFALGRHRSVR